MPATDALAPPMTPKEREIVKSYGGWTNFMHSFGLKPFELDDVKEATSILKTFAAADD
ncbi:hypothetical protein T439DRAFT_326182 [Meredithblackwellia eburnea MCA 4105]